MNLAPVEPSRTLAKLALDVSAPSRVDTATFAVG